MTFLELCQRVAQESGTVPNLDSPATVTGQEGRLRRIVDWTAQAYEAIQTETSWWLWMQAEFQGNVLVGTREYDGAAFGADRFADWVLDRTGRWTNITSWDPSVGRSDEGPLHVVPWPHFRVHHLTGSLAEDTGPVTHVSRTPGGKLSVYPLPDAEYAIRGVYRKLPQKLAADSDVPEMPADLHEIIAWRALLLLQRHDEAFDQMTIDFAEYRRLLSQLRLREMPAMSLPGPLA